MFEKPGSAILHAGIFAGCARESARLLRLGKSGYTKADYCKIGDGKEYDKFKL